MKPRLVDPPAETTGPAARAAGAAGQRQRRRRAPVVPTILAHGR